jgi:acetolactate synthase regulatory subunit
MLLTFTRAGTTPNLLVRTLSFFLLPVEFVARPSVGKEDALNTIERPDILIATGPSWSTFHLGHQLAKAWDCTYLVDYRDPWTVTDPDIALKTTTWHGDGPMGWLKRRWMECTERFLTSNVAGFTAATGPFLANAQNMLKDLPGKLIMNGTPPLLNPGPHDLGATLHVLHTGRLYHEQDWNALDRVLRLLHARGTTAADLQISMLGAISADNAALEILRSCSADTGLLHLEERVGREEVNARQQNVDALLHLGFRSKRGILPLKLLEYLSLGRPIIHLSNEDTEIEHIISTTQTGFIVDNDNNLLSLFIDLINQKKRGEKIPYFPVRQAIQEMGWENRMEEWRQFILQVHSYTK